MEINLKRMSNKQLLELDLKQLNTEQIRYVESRLVNEYNKRVRTLKRHRLGKQSNLTKKELRRKAKTVTRIPKGKKERNVRMANIESIRATLSKKTSTVAGVRGQQASFIKKFKEVAGITGRINSTVRKRIIDLISKARELYGGEYIPELGKKGGSPTWKIIYEVATNNNLSDEERLRIISETIENGYRAGQDLLEELEQEEDEEDTEELEFDEDDFESYFE